MEKGGRKVSAAQIHIEAKDDYFLTTPTTQVFPTIICSPLEQKLTPARLLPVTRLHRQP